MLCFVLDCIMVKLDVLLEYGVWKLIIVINFCRWILKKKLLLINEKFVGSIWFMVELSKMLFYLMNVININVISYEDCLVLVYIRFVKCFLIIVLMNVEGY